MALQQRTVKIPVGTIQLEAMVGFTGGTRGGPGVAICHPHPQFGGSMENNVVWALFRAFAEGGYVAVAFNFRGVGGSGGRHGGGGGEVQDVIGVLDWLEGRPETQGFGLGILGYSFGAWVGLRAAVSDARARCVGAVAPPVGMYSFDFLKELASPLLVVSGSEDPFCPAGEKEALCAGLGNDTSWKILEGVDHFFGGREEEAARYLMDGFARHLPPLPVVPRPAGR